MALADLEADADLGLVAILGIKNTLLSLTICSHRTKRKGTMEGFWLTNATSIRSY